MNENLNQPARKFPGPVRHGYQVEANAGKNPKLTARKSRPDRCKKEKCILQCPRTVQQSTGHCTFSFVLHHSSAAKAPSNMDMQEQRATPRCERLSVDGKKN
ncbi:MAG TPA: hypothetical protein VG962_03325 [Steroidobacteraceae bacterium]|nr:hypothetical protein [Steroidobacteraceae bacterium]